MTTTANASEIKDIFMEAIADVLSSNNIRASVYALVPNTAQLPYIKIDSIKSATNISVDPSIFLTTFNILAFDQDINNETLAQLSSVISAKFCEFITGKSKGSTVVKNAFIGESAMSEIIDKKVWQYECPVNIIYKAA